MTNIKKSLVPSERDYLNTAHYFHLLSEPIRLKIIYILLEGESGFQEIQQKLKISQPNLSQHINLLLLEEIVNRRKEGTYNFYSLNEEKNYTAMIMYLAGLPISVITNK